MTDNIFMSIENYLAKPDDDMLNQLKNCFNTLANAADVEDRVKEMAMQAFSESSRLVLNPQLMESKTENGASRADSPYIFRLTPLEEQKIETILSDLAQNTKKPPVNIDGLKHAVAGYFLRTPDSQFQYCNSIEAVIRKHTSIMRLKAEELHEREEVDAYTVLHNAHATIAKICQDVPLSSNIGFTQEQLDTIAKCLAEASESPHIQSQHPVTEKQVLHTFLRLLSSFGVLGLALTASKRGPFWHSEKDADKPEELTPPNPFK